MSIEDYVSTDDDDDDDDDNGGKADDDDDDEDSSGSGDTPMAQPKKAPQTQHVPRGKPSGNAQKKKEAGKGNKKRKLNPEVDTNQTKEAAKPKIKRRDKHFASTAVVSVK